MGTFRNWVHSARIAHMPVNRFNWSKQLGVIQFWFSFVYWTMISTVTLLRSCVVVVSKNLTKSVNSSSVIRAITHTQAHKPISKRNYSNTMRPQVFLTRSDFPAAGIDLLQNELVLSFKIIIVSIQFLLFFFPK